MMTEFQYYFPEGMKHYTALRNIDHAREQLLIETNRVNMKLC